MLALATEVYLALFKEQVSCRIDSVTLPAAKKSWIGIKVAARCSDKGVVARQAVSSLKELTGTNGLPPIK
jgi:hypothetical protein